MSVDGDLDGFELYAYIGEDEFGSGELGVKRGVGPHGVTALVSTVRAKLDHEAYRAQIAGQVRGYGKPVRLVRLVYVETVERFAR